MGVMPYVFGAITGVSIGLVIIAGLLLLRSQAGPRLSSAANGGRDAVSTSYRPGDIDGSRDNAIVAATRRVAPAVVSITATQTQRTRVYSWFWDRYYPRTRTFTNQGSGFVIDPSGYIFTNSHVIQNAQRITVSLPNGQQLSATLVGSAPSYDLALLKVDGEDLRAASLGDSDDLHIGEWAIAIGSPFGSYLADNQPTVTVGVISATHRDIKQQPDSPQIFNDMIQTDAAINPGNSGGPLVNAVGEVIGINTVIFSGGSGGNIGMGFAIPVNRAKRVFKEIVEHGRVRDVWLGMSATAITPQLAAALDLPSETGVLVQNVEEDGPADEAGVKPGDQLMAINGVAVQDRDHANRLIFGHGVGDELEVTVNRKDQLKQFRIRLKERPTDI